MLPALACATGEGWQRTDARTCEHAAPARLCVEARPDRGVVVHLGDLALVPGECADAPSGAGAGTGTAGRLALEYGDGEGRRRSVRLPRGRVTTLVVQDASRVRVRRDRCTRSPDVDG